MIKMRSSVPASTMPPYSHVDLIERTLIYLSPFTKRDREQDYAMVWAVLDELSHTA